MRMKHTIIALLTLGGTVLADPPCPPLHPVPKPPRHRVKRKSPPPTPKPAVIIPDLPPAPRCHCVGIPGRDGIRGPEGPKGEPGVTTVIVKTVWEPNHPIGLRLGMMGSYYDPHGDWAWGPMLQFTTDLSDRTELVGELGLAAPFDGAGWSPGRQNGYLLHVGVATKGMLGAELGVRYDHIVGNAQNNNIDATYIAADLGPVLRGKIGPVDLRAQLGVEFGELQDTNQDGTQFAIGLGGSLTAGVPW